MKILTAIMAMGNIKGEIKTYFKNQNGNLVISGFPSTRIKMEEFIKLSKSAGKINRIVFSDKYMDYNFYNNDWTYGNSEYCFQPKILPYIYNEGCTVPHSGTPYMNPLIEISDSLMAPYSILSVSYESESFYIDNLKDLVIHMLHDSCNLTAEHLAKYLSYVITKKQGSWHLASEIYMDFLERNFPGKKFNVVDGSGLSRKNFLSTYMLSSLSNKDISLLMPSPGQGTLKNRLLNLKHLNIHAKTGSLDGVSSLSGYIFNHDISFSIIINNAIENDLDNIIDETLNDILIKMNII